MKPLATCVSEAIRAVGVALPPGRGIDPLAALAYARELEIKRAAWRSFAAGLPLGSAAIADVVAAVLPRGYRATTRRSVVERKGRPILVLGDGSDAGGAGLLEPAAHQAIYASLADLLRSLDRRTCRMINHVVIRGTGQEHALILNVRALDAGIVRALRSLAERLRARHPAVRHGWIFVDPTGSRYYLEAERPAQGIRAKKLFGAAAWSQSVGSVAIQVGVFSFTQVNPAMLPSLVECVVGSWRAGSWSGDVGGPPRSLFDLYSGYGLFSTAAVGSFDRIVVVDSDEASVHNARYNLRREAARLGGPGKTLEALVLSLEAAAVRRLPRMDGACVVLDPPRSGTAPGVIAALGAQRPGEVVEVFCGPEEIGRSLREWDAAGYAAVRATALDLFPGTLGLEVVVRLTPRVGGHGSGGKPSESQVK